MAKTSIAKLAAYTLGGSFVAGVGLAAGRDTWKTIKKNFWLFAFIFAVFGFLVFPYLAGRELVRGHDRSFFATVFKTLIGNFLLFCLGLICGLIVIGLLYGLFLRGPEWDTNALNAAIGNSTGTLSIVLAGIGMAVGLWQRPKRKLAFRISDENEKFLETTGIVETGGEKVTHRDADGNDLRLIDTQYDRLDFLAVGQRNRCAYIHLDEEGRMIEYSGVVKSGSKIKAPKRVSKRPILG